MQIAKSYKTLKNKLDRVFALFIRKRDTKDGYGKCISCGKICSYENLDCGHFINRRHLSLRWNEKNSNAQCRSCNRFDEGNNIGYITGMIRKYGEGVINEMALKKIYRASYRVLKSSS